MRFAVIGGDMRQIKLSEFLTKDGHEVSVFAFDKIADYRKSAPGTITEAVKNAECIILPLPVTVGDGILNAPISGKLYTIEEVLSSASPRQLICAGKVSRELKKRAEELNLEIIDYLEREEFAISNAVATAEGAIQIIMEETDITVNRAKCLVIGFGRIGKALADRLNGLNADVTVSARRCSDIAWIEAYGYTAENTEMLGDTLSEYDVVINTVPAAVLGSERLMRLKKDCLCLDLASKPGGIDFSEASRLGIKTVWALSLPGEVAPTSTGKAIRDTIYNIVKNRDEK